AALTPWPRHIRSRADHWAGALTDADQTLSARPWSMRRRVRRARPANTETASSAVRSTGQLPGWLQLTPRHQLPARLDSGIARVSRAQAHSSPTAPRPLPRANAQATEAKNTP